MSRVKIVVEATPGENVSTTAETALALDQWARASGRNPLVVFVHNDREVTVFEGDTMRSLTSRWAKNL